MQHTTKLWNTKQKKKRQYATANLAKEPRRAGQTKTQQKTNRDKAKHTQAKHNNAKQESNGKASRTAQNNTNTSQNKKK